MLTTMPSGYAMSNSGDYNLKTISCLLREHVSNFTIGVFQVSWHQQFQVIDQDSQTFILMLVCSSD